MAEINAEQHSIREINQAIRSLIAAGETNIVVRNPGAQHNLAVAVLQPVSIVFDGSVGYYCGGMIDSARIEIRGSAGWGLGESMLDGTVIVRDNAGNGAGAAMRAGTIVIHGDAAARAGVSMKGGLIVIGGDCGYMSGFMGQKGKIVVCGDAGPAFADSMYETVCFVGGTIEDLGNDAVIEPLDDSDLQFLQSTLEQHLPDTARKPEQFKKVVAGRKLWNFEKQERALWREAL